MEKIPQNAFAFLPFSTEPLSRWTDQTDLLQFLYALYDVSLTGISVDDVNEYTSNMRFYGKELFDAVKNEVISWIGTFTKCANEAQPAPTSVKQTINMPDFNGDPVFGKAK